MFWTDLGTFGQIYFVIACIGTAMLVLQFLMLLIGFGGDADVDFGGDTDVDFDGDSSGGIGIFTLKGIIGFFAIAGWVGVACQLGGLAEVWSVVISVICGLAAFVAVGFAYKGIKSLQSNGIVKTNNAIGAIADVYLTIPAKGGGHGKISVVVQGRLTEYDAVTDEDAPIMTSAQIVVISVQGDTCKVSSDLSKADEIKAKKAAALEEGKKKSKTVKKKTVVDDVVAKDDEKTEEIVDDVATKDDEKIKETVKIAEEGEEVATKGDEIEKK